MRSLIFTLLVLAVSTTSYASLNKKQVKVRVTAPSGNIDETLIYMDQGISSVYNYPEDAQKIISSVPGVPALYSLSSDNFRCSINGFSNFSTTEFIPLGIVVDQDGSYTFSASMLDNFDETSIIQLEDKVTGIMQDLRAGSYTATITTTENSTGRFFIHASTAAQFTSANANCSNDNGSISLTTDNSITWDFINLYDASNNQLQSFTNVTSAANFSGLASGNYQVVFSRNGYTVTKSFTIQGNFITSNVTASTVTAFTGEIIEFHANAFNASQYSWDFGDGTLINGVANPENIFTVPGQYEVKLVTGNNFGCSDQASITVNIEQATGVSDPHQEEDQPEITTKANTLNVSLNNPLNSTLTVYNIIGQESYKATLTNNINSVDLNQLSTGTYIASVNNNGKVTSKRIAVSH